MGSHITIQDMNACGMSPRLPETNGCVRGRVIPPCKHHRFKPSWLALGDLGLGVGAVLIAPGVMTSPRPAAENCACIRTGPPVLAQRLQTTKVSLGATTP